MTSEGNATADWYRRFAETEARGQSAVYERWALGVAADAGLIELIEQLPPAHRQPNLIFAVSRLLGAPEATFEVWRDWLVANWAAVRAEAALRLTQTNEPRRCALALPVLARIGGPIALLEVGASAGLCLYPDRYSYDYDGVMVHPADGPSAVVLQCETVDAPPPPTVLPQIVWRAGIDLNPLDTARDEDMVWLETLIWPHQHERLARIRSAAAIVRADPPLLVKGDAVDALADLAAQAPPGATLVVMTMGVLAYLPPADRDRFTRAVSELDAVWICNEGQGVLPSVRERLVDARPPAPGMFVLSVDGHPLAWTGPHGQALHWIARGAA